MSELSARERARARGENTFQGNPCAKGHDGTRYTAGQNCVECSKERAKRQKEDLFYIGTPCNRGHDGTRYRSNGHCVQCDLAAAKARCEAGADKRQSPGVDFDAIRPPKPTNPQPGNGWPFGPCFAAENIAFKSGRVVYMPKRGIEYSYGVSA